VDIGKHAIPLPPPPELSPDVTWLNRYESGKRERWKIGKVRERKD
jgi:hypothetical protein